MTKYAGEEFLVTAVINDFDGQPITDQNGMPVSISIFDPIGVVVVDAEAMAYDADNAWWFFLWDTAGSDPGSYRTKVVVQGNDGGLSFEIGRIRIKRDPLA